MASKQAAVATPAPDSLPVNSPHAGRVESTGQPSDAFGGEGLELGLPMFDEVGVEDDVGVKDLAGSWVHPARPHGETAARGDPTKSIVINVFGIPVGLLWLLPDLDRRSKASLLKRCVPGLNAFADRLAVAIGNGLFDPENNRFLGW